MVSLYAPDRLERSARYRKAVGKLSHEMRRAVRRTEEKLETNPELPGLQVGKLEGPGALWYARVNQNYRVLFQQVDNVFRLVYVDEHDRALRAAASYWYDLQAEEVAFSRADHPQRSEMDMRLTEDVRRVVHSALERARLELDQFPGFLPDIIGGALDGGTEGKASTRTKKGGLSHPQVNVIPSDTPADCKKILVGLCFDADSFEKRISEVVRVAGIRCRNETKLVVLVTSKWDPRKWADYEADFMALDADLVILFAGPGGLVHIF